MNIPEDLFTCPQCTTDPPQCDKHGPHDLPMWAHNLAISTFGLDHPRLAHSQGVALAAQELSTTWPLRTRNTLISAAFLHDIGYAHPATGHHGIDGATYLNNTPFAPIAHYVAWHSTAAAEAHHRGLTINWPRPDDNIADVLWIADFTTGPDGTHTTPNQRLTDIRERYPAHSPVIRALDDSHNDFFDTLARYYVTYDHSGHPRRPQVNP